MSSSIFFFFFVPLLAFILLAVNFILAPHNPYQEKNGVFECGFTSFLGQNRTQFSISFFIFALLFLLFDLEILLVYPYLVSSYSNESYGLVVLLIFLLALTLGFVFELGKKALNIDSRQTIQNKEPNIHVSSAMLIPIDIMPLDYISYIIFHAVNLIYEYIISYLIPTLNYIHQYVISYLVPILINYIQEQIISYLVVTLRDCYIYLLHVVLSNIYEQWYLITIIMHCLMPLKLVLPFILSRGYLVAGGVQLFIISTCMLCFGYLFCSLDEYISLIAISYTIVAVSLFIGFNKDLKKKYPTFYKYTEIFLLICITILTLYMGFGIYFSIMYARGSSRITRSKTTANKGGGPNGGGPNGPNKPPYETTAACCNDDDDHDDDDHHRDTDEKKKYSTNKGTVLVRR